MPTQECQDSAIHYVIFTSSMPSESDISIQTWWKKDHHVHTFSNFIKSLAICLIIRDISNRVSDLYNICNFATTYDRQTAKKLAQPIHPSIATAQPLPLPICSERKYGVTSKPEPEPETRV